MLHLFLFKYCYKIDNIELISCKIHTIILSRFHRFCRNFLNAIHATVSTFTDALS